MIKLENVNKYFNSHKKNEIHVINNTSLSLPDTGLVALLGPSGCGKTTLLNTIGGLDNIKSGNIYINDKKVSHKSMGYVDKVRNLNIGYIFQNYYLLNNKTVFENVAISLKMIGIKDKEEIKKRVYYVLETLGIYRYKNRLVSMLSGGERQRVGIARAIVKNPHIIIADEPTGNLDSTNTIETMNIIKSISKNRLVILVTHESDIAKFYADRIIEIDSGTIIKDYENKKRSDLDYKIDNKIYLKDFKYHNKLDKNDNKIEIYNDSEKDLNLTVVVKNGNIYIKGNKNSKIEVIDENSNIELVNDHYKKIDKSIYEKYEFDFENIINENYKPRYSSIYNPFKIIHGGFKKILDFSILKKILLLGFLFSGAFIAYCIFNIFGLTNIEDSYFIKSNKDYYALKQNISVDNYGMYENISSVDYILPGEDSVAFNIKYDFYYQTKNANSFISGSLTSSRYLDSKSIIMGSNVNGSNEIVVDKMILDSLVKSDYQTIMVGMNDISKFLNMKVTLKNDIEFTIVGIVDSKTPCIYAKDDMLINILANTYSESNGYEDIYVLYDASEEENIYLDYNLKNITLKKGKMPTSDYEVVVSSNLESIYPIDKYSNLKINGEKLKVVGYYEANGQDYISYVNNNTIKYKLISENNNVTIMPLNKEYIEEDFKSYNLKVYSIYDYDLNKYKEDKIASVKASLIVSGIILLISFIEIYLMIRSSFLSRIKEIGTLRAIGVKRKDIYKMFFGEIFAITTTACLPGVLFTSYALSKLSTITYFKENYLVNFFTIVLSIIIIYLFNIIIGLLPVMKVVKDRPAKILARKDID